MIMEGKKIIMNFTIPPSLTDLEEMAGEILDSLPDELADLCDGVAAQLEDFPDETTEQELDLEDAYELLALYKNGKEISPGVEKKTANDDDILVLYRRPILDMWCESGQDLEVLMRQIIIEELGRHFDFSDDDLDEMVQNYAQGSF